MMMNFFFQICVGFGEKFAEFRAFFGGFFDVDVIFTEFCDNVVKFVVFVEEFTGFGFENVVLSREFFPFFLEVLDLFIGFFEVGT
jgi:hypothetical protein